MARTNQRSIPVVLFAIAIALLAGRVVLQTMKSKEVAAQGLVRWVSIEEGERLARATHKPVMYDFTAEWCGPCHLLDGEVFLNPALAADINERFIPVRVLDRRQEEGDNKPAVDALQQRYSVRGFPTVVFADANGDERARMEGFPGREGFEKIMESVR